MRKFLNAKMLLSIAVCLLVSMSIVFASEESFEEKWRLVYGSENVRYGTKYTIIINEEKYEFNLNYKEQITKKFKGYYWGAKEKNQDLEYDENYIFEKDKINFTRDDVIEFLEIKDAKLAALIKEGYGFSLYLEPYYTYKKGKWSDTYTSTLRELYSMLPEANSKKIAYENARNLDGEILKNKIQGVEFLREIIVDTMNSLEAKEKEEYKNFKNEYKDKIKSTMINKGWIAYSFESEKIKIGEFLEMIVKTLWPDFEYKEVEEGEHYAKPYANALDRKVLMTIDYDYEKLEKEITRKEAARLLCLFYINYKEGNSLNNTYEYIESFKDEALITEEIERICVDDVVRFGLMKAYEDGTFRPNNTLTKKEAEEIFAIAKLNP